MNEENKDKEKEILKKGEKDEEIKKGKKEVEKVDKIKDKKSKEFYLFTTNNINNKKKQEKNENTNTNNNINNEVEKKKEEILLLMEDNIKLKVMKGEMGHIELEHFLDFQKRMKAYQIDCNSKNFIKLLEQEFISFEEQLKIKEQRKNEKKIS